MPQRATSTSFKKGDPRIWRGGRPRTPDDVRILAQAIAHEVATDKDGNPIVIDGHKVTVGEYILRSWAKNPRMQERFVERAFGKVPQITELRGATDDAAPIVIQLIDYRAGITETEE